MSNRRCACKHGAIRHHPIQPFACLEPGCGCSGYHVTERRQQERRIVQRGGRRLSDLQAADDGIPLTPPELAEMAGFSRAFIHEEIQSGRLTAIRFGSGLLRKRRLILWEEAKRYLRQVGLLKDPAA